MNQINIFEYMYEPYKIRTPIRLIECFAGIGSQAKALERLGANFEHHRVVEFDKYAIASYNAIHGTKFETSDITKIHAWDLGIEDTDEFTYLLTYSFPCQDLSLAGKQRGMKKGSGTRSGLLWEVERLLDECDELPQILLMENVPEVIGSKNIEHFQKWAAKLETLGYKNYTQILNAKNYGIPQNRRRCFMVSILGDYYYEFPEPFELKLRLKDMLDDEVDEKYFLSEKAIQGMKETTFQTYKLENRLLNKNKCARTILARFEGASQCVEVFDYRYDEGIRGRVDKDISPTLTCKTGSLGISGQPLIKIPEATKKGYAEAYDGDGIYINRPHQKRVVVQKGMIQTLKTSGNDVGVVVGTYQYSKSDNFMNGKSRFTKGKDIADTIQTSPKEGVVIKKNLKQQLCNSLIENGLVQENDVIRHSYSSSRMDGKKPLKESNNIIPTLDTRCDCLGVVRNLRIRKLTPKECFRLMGFDDDDFHKAKLVNSNAQLYKQAGNSIVVNVLEEIFKKLL